MDNISQVLMAICVGTVVAHYLLGTSRVVKAIELCKECLILLNNKALQSKNELLRSVYIRIYSTMFTGYSRISDHTRGIECGTKLLALLRACGEKATESRVTLALASVYYLQGKYQEAKHLNEKALSIIKETGDREGEAACYGNLGVVCESLGEYGMAEEYQKKALVLRKEIGDRLGEAMSHTNLGTVYEYLGEYDRAKELHTKALVIAKEIGNRQGEAFSYGNLGTVYHFLGEYGKAEEYQKKSLMIRKEIGDRGGEAVCYGNLGTLYHFLGEYEKAESSQKKALTIRKEIGDRKGEATSYTNLGAVCQSLGKYNKAEEYQKKALVITKETGYRRGQAACYENIGNVHESRGDFDKAEEYQKEALVIRQEIGDRAGEASCYGHLGTVYESFGEYEKAEAYQNRALVIRKEINDRKGEAESYRHLGSVCKSLGKYNKAEEYQKKALVITKEIGDRAGEATCYHGLGDVYESLGGYEKAEEHVNRALAISKEIGDRANEASCYSGLGAVYQSLGKYHKAEEYQKKALAITKEIGDRQGEASCYGSLGTVYLCLGDYGKTEEYQNKALVIQKEIGDRPGEAASYGILGSLYHSLGEYGKAEEYLKKALKIGKEIGDRYKEATNYGNLGTTYYSVGKYGEAEELQRKALVIRKQIGDRKGEAVYCRNLGTVYQSLGEYGKADECQKTGLVISKEIGDRQGEATSYGMLGTLSRLSGSYAKAKEYHEKALTVSKEIGDIDAENVWHLHLAFDTISEGNISLQHEVLTNLFASLEKCEKMRSFLRDNEQLKISLLDKHSVSYNSLCWLFCFSGNANEALNVEELGSARALADLMSARYSVKQQISVKPQEWLGIERIMKQETNCNCLYISYCTRYMFLWVLKENEPILFRRTDVNQCFVSKGLERTVEEVFSEESALRKFYVLHKGDCEDRSLFPSDASHSAGDSSLQDNMAAVRQVEEESQEDQQPVPTPAECYNMIIAPVPDLLDKPELVIIPDSILYKVPFAALKDESGKYLSESFRIRIVPSLNTLKLIQDSPADYHSHTGALIVGEPDVSEVLYKGRVDKLCPLPCARREAEMIGRLLGAQPLLGKQATKRAVLRSIQSVSLIHFAAHGNAERGEIALAPKCLINCIPREEDYLLTMADISEVHLRAKLVVLSCCHSASGRVRAEGVIGIARAFLGSGARSVLVALWALEDSATEQLMSRFYEHLVRGESASESLHQAMKWMRSKGYSDVRDWAPFMLIGDNVTFNFGK